MGKGEAEEWSSDGRIINIITHIPPCRTVPYLQAGMAAEISVPIQEWKAELAGKDLVDGLTRGMDSLSVDSGATTGHDAKTAAGADPAAVPNGSKWRRLELHRFELRFKLRWRRLL